VDKCSWNYKGILSFDRIVINSQNCINCRTPFWCVACGALIYSITIICETRCSKNWQVFFFFFFGSSMYFQEENLMQVLNNNSRRTSPLHVADKCRGRKWLVNCSCPFTKMAPGSGQRTSTHKIRGCYIYSEITLGHHLSDIKIDYLDGNISWGLS
jgi:hypothetical protein